MLSTFINQFENLIFCKRVHSESELLVLYIFQLKFIEHTTWLRDDNKMKHYRTKIISNYNKEHICLTQCEFLYMNIYINVICLYIYIRNIIKCTVSSFCAVGKKRKIHKCFLAQLPQDITRLMYGIK